MNALSFDDLEFSCADDQTAKDHSLLAHIRYGLHRLFGHHAAAPVAHTDRPSEADMLFNRHKLKSDHWDAEIWLALQGVAPDGHAFHAAISISILAMKTRTARDVAERIAGQALECLGKRCVSATLHCKGYHAASEDWDAQSGMSLSGVTAEGSPFFANVTVLTRSSVQHTAWQVADRIAEQFFGRFESGSECEHAPASPI